MAVPADTIKKIDEGFAKLQASEECKSLLKKHLTKAVVTKLKVTTPASRPYRPYCIQSYCMESFQTKKTRLGATLLDVIQSGVENLDSGVGLYAPDAEAYTIFADLFNPVIEEYHNGFKATDTQPTTKLGDKNVSCAGSTTQTYPPYFRTPCTPATSSPQNKSWRNISIKSPCTDKWGIRV